METLLSSAGLLVAGAITPGPNNFVVMREAARSGWRGVVPAMAGIVSGGLGLLLLAFLGIGAVLAALPRLVTVIAVAGCVYLGYLGLRLTAWPTTSERERGSERLPSGVWGLFVFQFLNPKAWLVILTVSASAQAELGALAALPLLVVLLSGVLTVCLGLWAWAGIRLQGALSSETARAWFDRVMGFLLLLCALLLLITNFEVRP